MKTLQLVPVSQRKHPLFIAALIIGLVIGLFAAIPKAARGWVVAAILAAILWFSWTTAHDIAERNSYVLPDIDAWNQRIDNHQSPLASPTVRRAELVRLPNK